MMMVRAHDTELDKVARGRHAQNEVDVAHDEWVPDRRHLRRELQHSLVQLVVIGFMLVLPEHHAATGADELIWTQLVLCYGG